jgi:hypothetical protein
MLLNLYISLKILLNPHIFHMDFHILIVKIFQFLLTIYGESANRKSNFNIKLDV